MKRTLITSMLMALALLISMPAFANRIPFAQPGEDAARVTGVPGDPSRDIFPVRFVAVNGINIPGDGRDSMWLEPGSYTLRVISTVRVTGTGRHRSRPDQGYNEIEVVIEAGRTYHIGMKYDRSLGRSPFSTVLYLITE